MFNRLLILLVVLGVPTATVAQPTWIAQTLPQTYEQATGVNTADLDLDGTLELLVTSESMGIDAWSYLNDTWEREVIYNGAGGAAHASAHNMDNDPELEIVASCNQSDQLILCDRDNDGSWSYTVIDSDVDYLYHHSVGDLDNDGDLDIVGSVYFDSEVRWWENLGNGQWTVHSVGPCGGVVRAVIADMNGDGEPDIVASGYTGHTLWLFTNTGGAVGWSSEPLLIAFAAAYGVLPVDVDSDGDMDLFASADDDHEIRLLRNTPDGFVSEIIVTGWNGARDMVWVDLDGGGVNDIVCAAHWNGVAWFEGEANWARHDVELDNGGGRSEVVVADLDGDNDLDIASEAWYNGTARVWMMEGSGGPVQLNLTLHDPPVTLPPSGGSVLFDVHITSELAFAVGGLTGFTNIELPNGQVFGPLLQQPLALPPFADISIFNLSQVVPPLAPAGTYHYYGYLGLNQNLFISDSFVFSKAASVASEEDQGVIPHPSVLNLPATPPLDPHMQAAGIPTVVRVPQVEPQRQIDYRPEDWPTKKAPR